MASWSMRSYSRTAGSSILVACLSLTILIAGTDICIADVIPGGEVSGMWDAAGSPYLITGEILVPEGLALAIEPGVEVRFQGHYKFNVRGQLLAVGTAQDSILFTADDPTEGWHSLRFLDTDITGQPLSQVRFCRIEYGRVFGSCPDNSGGGIYLGNADAVIANNLITNNTSVAGTGNWGGGGICCEYSHPTIIDNTITQNHTAGDGGAILCYYSHPLISGNVIADNTTGSRGGAIALFMYSTADIVGNEITGNATFGGSGGGIYCSGSAAQITNNIIAGNSGHGIANYLSNCWIVGNLIEGNSATRGAGIQNEGSNPWVINNTIVENQAGQDGGGIYNTFVFVGGVINSDPVIINTILYGNTAATGLQICSHNTSLPTLSYSDLQDLAGDGVAGPANLGDGMLDEDPLFVGIGAHPFALDGLSPCCDTGNPDVSGLNLPAEDLAGHPRIGGDRIDMGAYEFTEGSPVPGGAALAALVLAQNYPNPFNPMTTIRFELPVARTVCLRIYTIAGALVTTLADRELAAGTHDIVWQGIDNQGRQVASGTYIYRLSADGHTAAKRMVLIR